LIHKWMHKCLYRPNISMKNFFFSIGQKHFLISVGLFTMNCYYYLNFKRVIFPHLYVLFFRR
jgi:hypothetical protein